MTNIVITAEFYNPHDFIAHPDNRPGGLKQDHIESLAQNMREKGFDEDYFVKYFIPDDTWPAEHANLKGKRVLLGGHHRVEAAKLAKLDKIPAKLKQMTYLESLEFLDKDNEYSPLHWYEQGILHEKRRALLGLAALPYGRDILGQMVWSSTKCTYSELSPVVRQLMKEGIKTEDLRELSFSTAQEVCRLSPKQDWLTIFDEIRNSALPRNAKKLRATLDARYAKTTQKAAPIPNETSYLYVATSPHTDLVKCGMTTGEDPVKYIQGKASGTWVLDFSHYHSVEIPTVHIQEADRLMRDKLTKGWPGIKEFHPIPPNTAKRILFEIAAHFADK